MALSQKEKIGKVLQGLKENVTSTDRKEYMERFDKKKNIVSYYLNGIVFDIETGMGMIEFFSQRIEGRNKKIEELESQTV